jgi:hypothetical protein
MTEDTAAHNALTEFASTVAIRAASGVGQAEAAIVGPLASVIETIGSAFGLAVVTAPEAAVASVGRPDVGVLVDGLLTGYVEAKAPGVAVGGSQLRGRDREQWQRFSLLPNLIYTNGQSWILYRHGERTLEARLPEDPASAGAAAVDASSARDVRRVFEAFLRWEPVVPSSARELAVTLAPLCRFLASEVLEAVQTRPEGAIASLWQEWRQLLFHDAGEEQFADAYAQTVTFSLLLARVEGSSVSSLDEAVGSLRSDHGLLAEVLRTLATSPAVAAEVGTGVLLLQRAIDAIQPDLVANEGAGTDPWLYFYEDFLAAYDPRLREQRGAYYTPAEVVGAQVTLVEELLRTRLQRPLGFAEEGVFALDPAAGTGSYPLRILDQALARAREALGPGAIPAVATRLAQQLLAFEILVGPYAVCQLRLTREFDAAGASLPDGPRVYLTDTLESPNAEPPGQISLLQRPLAEEHARAQEVKRSTPILVCIGNPPYDDQRDPQAERKGGWVRFGDEGGDIAPIYEDFLRPARDAGYGLNLRYAYNDYLYFWRWAVWKVCEGNLRQPGIVSYISAASYLQGTPYVGMREHLRRQFDEIWIIDLEGEASSERQTANVFAIRTPVAIAVCLRLGEETDTESPATVHYTRIEGARDDKLAQLKALRGLGDLEFTDCPADWHAPFFPAATGAYAAWPALTEVLPWAESGLSAHRMWPIAPQREVLEARWRALVAATPDERRSLFVSTSDRTPDNNYPRIGQPRSQGVLTAITSHGLRDDPMPDIEPFSWCFLDDQWIMADNRVLDRPRPNLWSARSSRQAYIITKMRRGLGSGPAIVATPHIPDFNPFGSGSGRIFPVFSEDAESPWQLSANVDESLLQAVSDALGAPIEGLDLIAYTYAALSNPAYSLRFGRELEQPDPRVPITLDPQLFEEGVALGRELLWVHTSSLRFADEGSGRPAGAIRAGAARCLVGVPSGEAGYPTEFHWDEESATLHVGDGQFGPVARSVFDYRTINLNVVGSWLDYRIRPRPDASELELIRQTSWTDADTRALLNLLWTVEAAVEIHSRQSDWLDRVLAGGLFSLGLI